MVKDVPDLPSGDRDHMWLGKEELLTWNPQQRRRQALSAAEARQAGDDAMIDDLLAQPRHAAADRSSRCPALVGAALMLVLRHPMQVAMALISTMVFLGGIYGLLGVHFIAAFQVLIYVSAVMVFMVYVIMLLDVRDASFTQRFSALLVPGVAGGALLLRRARLRAVARRRTPSAEHRRCSFGLQQFSVAFLNEYWLHFELTSVLLVAAVVAALAVIKGSGGTTWIRCSSCSLLAVALFALGLLGVIVRRNLLVMLMCMELMLNGVNLSLVTFAQQTGTAAGAVLVFLIFVVAAAEIAIAIPIVLLLVRRKRTLDADAYTDLKG